MILGKTLVRAMVTKNKLKIPNWIKVLAYAKKGNLSGITRLCDIHNGGGHELFKDLEDAGYIRKVINKKNRRETTVEIEPKGKRLYDACVTIIEEIGM